MKNSTLKIDSKGNLIGNGEFHANYHVCEFDNKDIYSSVYLSSSSESVYVSYRYNDKSITVRFSDHVCNAVEFGDQLDGNFATKNDILFALGLVERVFVPETFLSIFKQCVKKTEIANYAESNLTISELYDLGANSDISQHTGKLAKGSNYLILGSKVELLNKTKVNRLGQSVTLGNYIYL